MTTSTATTTAPYAELAAAVRGDLILPGEPGYDQARAVYNAMIDKHPAAIASCRDTADIITCVRFARSHGIEIAVRGGGHNAAGFGVWDVALLEAADEAVHLVGHSYGGAVAVRAALTYPGRKMPAPTAGAPTASTGSRSPRHRTHRAAAQWPGRGPARRLAVPDAGVRPPRASHPGAQLTLFEAEDG